MNVEKQATVWDRAIPLAILASNDVEDIPAE